MRPGALAVLTAIAIPVFTTQLEKSREATDAANIRGAYAEIAALALTDPDNDHTSTINKKQTQDKWQAAVDIAGVKVEADTNDINSTTATVVKYDKGTMKMRFPHIPLRAPAAAPRPFPPTEVEKRWTKMTK